MGKFKSSGILVSTGTGSSGWLYAAKAISPHTVAHFRSLIGLNEKQQENVMFNWQNSSANDNFATTELDRLVAKRISDKTLFPVDRDEMFYFVREGFQETKISEGFCQKLMITNDMLRGEVSIDGQVTIPIEIGDKIELKTHPDLALRCLRLY